MQKGKFMELTYIVDAVLALIFLFVVLHSARVGLAKSLAGIVAWIAASVIALQCCAPAAERVYVYFFQDRVISALQEKTADTAGAQEIVDAAQAVLQDLPQFVVDTAQSVGIDTEALVQKTENLDAAGRNVAQALERTVFAPVCTAALKAVLFFLMLVIAALLGRLLLSPLCGLIEKTPVIGKTDRMLGGILGMLKGAVLVTVLAILLRVAAGFADEPFAQAVEQSKVVSLIAESPFANGFFE